MALYHASRRCAASLQGTRAPPDGAYRTFFDSGTEVARGLRSEPEPSKNNHRGQGWNRELGYTLASGQDGVVHISDESGKLNIARAISNPGEAPPIRDAVRRHFEYLARLHPKGGRNWNDLEDKVLRRLSSREPLQSLDGLREAGLEVSLVFGSDGLSRYLTCFGDGKINLNTAPRAVLASLDSEFDDAMVERVAGYRGNREGEPGPYKPFEEPEDLMLVEGIVNRSVGADGQFRIVRNLYEKVQALVSVKSVCFSARIEATVEGRHREAWSFFKPSGSRLAFEEVAP